MQAAGIKAAVEAVTQVEIDNGKIVGLTMNGYGTFAFDSLYSACAPRSSLAGALRAALENHCVVADEHQRSTVANFFVAGDVAKGVDQISVAMGHAAAAAVAIHNSLRE
jgi:thioredoxin reductase (NADPH)